MLTATFVATLAIAASITRFIPVWEGFRRFDAPAPPLSPPSTVTWPPDAEGFAPLRETFGVVVARSPHYRRMFAYAGVRLADLATYDEFRTRVPRIEKTALVAAQSA